MKHKTEKTEKKAVILLSGGVDSATVLAMAGRAGFDVYALSFRYGQRHGVELDAATRIARNHPVVRHLIMEIDLRPIGGSALTADLAVPKHACVDDMGTDIPVTYVPARNTIFLSLALAWAEVLEAPDIFIGVNAVDYSGYPDCRPEYVKAFESMANLALKATVEGKMRIAVRAPLLAMTKAEIIRRGTELGAPYHLTHSCYDPDAAGRGCGRCDSCLLRKKGFQDAGIQDPANYLTGER